MKTYTKKDIINLIEEEDVSFIRLQFVDIYGMLKNVAVTASQLQRILDNEITFDCGAIEGFENKNLSKLVFVPDLSTFAIFPWRPQSGKVARFICDVRTVDDTPFENDSRYILKKVLKKAAKNGYYFNVGPECEFFLFDLDNEGNPTTTTTEKGSYFEVGPVDKGENARRDMVLSLSDMGFEIESSYHSDEHAQHQIDFKYASPLHTADNILTFKLAVHTVARRHGFHATFMPKPRTEMNGSGLHTHITVYKDGNNIFRSEEGKCTEEGYAFMAGILHHLPGMTLVNNTIINSYKRLFGLFDKMVAYNCNEGERYALLQMTNIGRMGAGIVLRSPDAACNPYLMLACLISAGLDGINNKMNLDDFTDEYLRTLPRNMEEAIKAFDKDTFMKGILGDNLSDKLIARKKQEWKAYCMQVSSWEIDQYLDRI